MPELEIEKPIKTKEYRIWKAIAISSLIVIFLLAIGNFVIKFSLNVFIILITYGAGFITYYLFFRKTFPESIDDVLLWLKRKEAIFIDNKTVEIQELFTGTNIWGIFVPEQHTTYVVDLHKKYVMGKRKKGLDSVKEEMIETDIDRKLLEREAKLKQRTKELGIEYDEVKG